MVDTDKLISLGIALVPTYRGLRYPALPAWQEMATTAPQVISRWKTEYPDFNYCCVAKQESVGIVDIDDLPACKAAGLPPLPITFTTKSPKGYHAYFRQSAALRALGNRAVQADERKVLEVKCHNTAVAAPGCVRDDGKEYTIYQDEPLIEMPQEWIDWIIANSTAPKRHGPRLRKFHPDFDAEELFSHYEWEFAREFEKDGATYYVFAECPLAERVHEDQIRSAKTCLIIGRTVGFDCKSCGEEHNYGDLLRKMEENGFDPFPGFIFEDEDDALLFADVDDIDDISDGRILIAEEVAARLNGVPIAPSLEELPPVDTTSFTYLWNDTGNAERLVRDFGNRIRHADGKWFVWNGRSWAPDHYRRLERMAEKVVVRIFNEANQLPEKEREAQQRWAIKCGDRSRRTNMIAVAAAKRGVLKRLTDFDQDLWAFNVKNGTIDLRTGQLRPHNCLDNITKIAPVTYDPKATCPLWDRFLGEVMLGRQHLVDYLAITAGYSLTGDTSLQAMFFNHGEGENGKGVFTETLSYIVGDYGQVASFDTFTYHEKKSGLEIRNDLACLVGIRFLTAEESSDGHRLDEALIKQLTGENTIRTRFLYQEEFSYKPAFKIWMCSNHRPSIRTQDWGTWRRVKMLPWEYIVPKGERDEQLKAKLRREASGILNWMLKGLSIYVAAGCKISYPKEVEAATSEYREAEDIVGQFLAARCVLGEGSSLQSGDIYRAFKIWAEQAGERRIITQRKLGDELQRHRIMKKKVSAGTWFLGISLKHPWNQSETPIRGETAG
jgi:P4 family phage/plasmid primase-like protien